jgi:hypothetical protein
MGGGKQPRHWAPLLEALGVFLPIMGYIWWLLARCPWTWLALAALLAATHAARGGAVLAGALAELVPDGGDARGRLCLRALLSAGLESVCTGHRSRNGRLLSV